MKIYGLQKMTLLDYPGKIAATVFTAGCNFRCPWCHNASLVLNTKLPALISGADFFTFLEKRRGWLDGVCITGGEPLLQKDLPEFIEKIKNMGFLVKLDTNGSFPAQLKELVNRKLVDYVAMDIKNSPAKYGATIDLTSAKEFLPQIQESISFLLENQVEYEFRTTLVREFHSLDDLKEIAHWIQGAEHYYLQNFEDSGDLIQSGFKAFTKEELEEIVFTLNSLLPHVELRN